MSHQQRTVNRRRFLQSSIAAGVYLAGASSSAFAASPNEEINLGVIGCGWRGGQLTGTFHKLEGVNVVGLYDPDTSRAHGAKNGQAKSAKIYSDLRAMLDDDRIDAVAIAACNHWHCLASIWAMQAGKDVYVEKPLAHNQWEGRQVVAAARRYKRICQVGTQQRSDPMQAEIKKFLHQEQALGPIVSARVNRYGRRATIGRRSTPLTIDPQVNYDMWLGPAQDQPLYRNEFHYDWHWDWNTGSGEMGNWGAHVLDDLRNIVLQDKVSLPNRVIGGGGRVTWNDAGQTPNVHFVYFDTDEIPVVMGLSNLTEYGDQKHPGPGSGYIAYCEGGRLEGRRGGAQAFDEAGKEIKTFKGTSGNVEHQQNFIDALRAGDASLLNAEVELGHLSTSWCNLANIAYRAGENFTHAAAKEFDGDGGIWAGLLGEIDAHLGSHKIDIESALIQLSPMLDIDVKNEVFTGDHAARANAFLKRQYRAGYEVPDLQ